MAAIRIDSGRLEGPERFRDIGRDRWVDLVEVKKDFLARQIGYDCRCLIEACQEAEEVYGELGYASAADMIRNGYDLEPDEIELAVAWLKINEPAAAIGMDAIKAKVAEARAQPLPGVGAPEGNKNALKNKIAEARSDPLVEPGPKNKGDNITFDSRGTGTDYTLRRLARDAPELLDKIEAGEMNVNQAAIAAGIRKKPSNAEKAVAAFRKSENRLEPLKLMVGMLEPYELAVLRDWCIERLD